MACFDPEATDCAADMARTYNADFQLGSCEMDPRSGTA
jgi:hypothetical protein